ncbi:hypothetical protein H0E87_007358 [Populus deltoides]|uniref:Pentatricopeptide repeat-containing protein n=1 Tax=Populus deltoides TaxID=3696 RepID=A0A8T2ZA78_POPDE|nr:hypothetical protein H0E87_007358 [Populus deltoides]
MQISKLWVEGFVLEKKVEVNSYVGSALIDMYGKCRDLISARRVFDSMPNKDVVTWNAIITGASEAWDLIKKMLGKPSEIVLGSLLGACQRCRNADVGERTRVLMRQCGVSKTPCCNWIDIGPHVHEFHSGISFW